MTTRSHQRRNGTVHEGKGAVENMAEGVLIVGDSEDFTCRVCHKPMAGPIREGPFIVGVCPEDRFVRTFAPHLQTDNEFFDKMRAGRPLAETFKDRLIAAALATGHRPAKVTLQLIEAKRDPSDGTKGGS